MKYIAFTAFLFLGVAAFAQPGPAGAPPPQSPNPPQPPGALGHRPGARRGGMPEPDRPMGALRPGPQGRWWGNPELAQKLGITADQAKKMDDILQQHRLRLVDLRATLEKRDLSLEPLVSADQPDEPKILAQIDQVAQARAELEKANARMLLEIRRVLTADQWQKLKAEHPGSAPGEGMGGPRGGGPRRFGR
jgi:Spy/CpxP family protein refolding chaperone